MSKNEKKKKAEVFAASRIERNVTISLEKPQVLIARHFVRVSRILYFMSTILPLPNVKIAPEVKDAMVQFLADSWKEVEDYLAEVDEEYSNLYREKMLPLDGFNNLQSSSEKQFKLNINCPAVSRFINIILQYDKLLKKIDFYWLSGYMDDVVRLKLAKMLDNKLNKHISNISIINKAMITKKYKTFGFGGEDELTQDEIRALEAANSGNISETDIADVAVLPGKEESDVKTA